MNEVSLSLNDQQWHVLRKCVLRSIDEKKNMIQVIKNDCLDHFVDEKFSNNSLRVINSDIDDLEFLLNKIPHFTTLEDPLYGIE